MPRVILRSRESALRTSQLRSHDPRSCSHSDSRSRSRGHGHSHRLSHEPFATVSTRRNRNFRNHSRARSQPQSSSAREVCMDCSRSRSPIQYDAIMLSRGWTLKVGGIALELQKLFEQRNWQDASLPLFSSFKNFLKTLPVRRLRELVLKLYKLPFFCKENDLVYFAETLNRSVARHAVSYLCARSGSGKTASVLVGFIQNAFMNGGLERYIYLPFSNNEGNYHYGTDCSGCIHNSASNNTAACQLSGANFMLACLQHAVRGDWVSSTWNSRERNLESVRLEYRHVLNKILRNCSAKGMVLLHVDEHRKMSTCREFRRGALSLAATGSVRVIATYTEPPDIDPDTYEQSSELCRDPVAMLPVHIASLLAWLGLDYWKRHSFSEDASTQRKLNALHISTGLVFDVLGLVSLHAEPWGKAKAFIQGFKQLINRSPSSHHFIRESLKLCKDIWLEDYFGRPIERLVELMCGIDDSDADPYLSNDRGSLNVSSSSLAPANFPPGSRSSKTRLKSPLMVAGNCLTAPLYVLLKHVPAETGTVSDLYLKCQKLFVESITKSDDYASGQVLERAYLWNLACIFAGGFHQQAANRMFATDFMCEDVTCGRIFEVEGHQLRLSDAAHTYVEPRTLFYAEESQRSHPRCDLWFTTRLHKGGVVHDTICIIEIGGTGREEDACTKVAQTEEAVRTLSQQMPQHRVSGVVLLPNYSGTGISSSNTCYVYSAAQAQQLLGGLKQILPFMEATD